MLLGMLETWMLPSTYSKKLEFSKGDWEWVRWWFFKATFGCGVAPLRLKLRRVWAVAFTSWVEDMIGGSDTIAVTHTWALALLLNNGPALKKAQNELDMKIGKDRQVNESDIPKLVYLQAIVKETLRLSISASDICGSCYCGVGD
ncbi:hypothetical protein Droror1_Dr00027836 [Drosera rotundifolia]